jgi:glycosyltransferase involved in cell wall biosynthesis
MKTDMIILLSETFKRDLIKIGLPESKLNVLYNFHTLKNNIDINLKHDKSIINLLFIGSISERKGFKDIIEALKLVKINYRLNVLGEFPSESMRNYCKAQVLKNNLNIVFQGYISGEDKINFISNSDILILPSYEEGFPMVIPESMALGCAIIASNIAGIPEIVKENENGFLISPGQIDKLAEKIIWLHENKESLEMFKKNSLKLSGEYNIERYINKLSFLYNQEN